MAVNEQTRIAEEMPEILDAPLNVVKSEDVQLDITFDQLKRLVSEKALTGENMLLNMGPHHPSTHGVLRLLLELDGETIVNCIPDIGYLHTGIEKTVEGKAYLKGLPMTDRTDYMSPMSNNLAFCGAIEKLVGIDVPLRAQYLRVILMELTRMNSHLVWLGTHALDIGAMSMFLYCFREREMILDIYEAVSGARMMSSFIRPGGLWRDVPTRFEDMVKQILNVFPGRILEYEKLLKENPMWKERTIGVGKISAEDAIAYGLTGPCLRGSGVNYDVRKAQPYSSYEHFDFSVPLGSAGDVYDRYRCRLEEFNQSLSIIRQALAKLPAGPVMTDDRKISPPPKARDRIFDGIADSSLQTVDRRLPRAGWRGLFRGRIRQRRIRRAVGRRWLAATAPHAHARAVVQQPAGAAVPEQGRTAGRRCRDHRVDRYCVGRCRPVRIQNPESRPIACLDSGFFTL